jgi:hypothetical protein
MRIIDGIRNRLRRHQADANVNPPALDPVAIIETKPESPVVQPVTASAITMAEGAMIAAAVEAPAPPPAIELRAVKLGPAAIAQRTFDELVALNRRIAGHIAVQTDAVMRITGAAEAIRDVPESLAAIARQDSRVIELLGEYLSLGRARDEAASAALTRVHQAGAQQMDVLDRIGRQLDLNQQAAGRITETLEVVQSALGDLVRMQGRWLESLGELVRTSKSREAKLAAQLERTRKLVLWTTIGAAVLALGAIVTIALSFLM